MDNGYAGVFVWDLSQDDFANVCGYGPSPLMNAIKSAQAGVPFTPLPALQTPVPSSTSFASTASTAASLQTSGTSDSPSSTLPPTTLSTVMQSSSVSSNNSNSTPIPPSFNANQSLDLQFKNVADLSLNTTANVTVAASLNRKLIDSLMIIINS